MLGLMQSWPLRCSRIMDHAARVHPDREITSRSIEGPLHRTTWGDVRLRSRKLAQALSRAGLKKGERVATLAWNTWRHIEVWYGVMGAGGVCHTINPRLFPQQIAWIANHAEDRLMFVDLTFVPLLEKLAPALATIERVVVLTDDDKMPVTNLARAISYETFIEGCDGDFAWVEGDENEAAGMCYTSGTTGDPKGVLYSHRSNVLHAMTAVTPDCLNLSSRDVVLPVVPMFHANGWSVPFGAPMVGAKLVLPGARLDGASLQELLDQEEVTVTLAVPTVWLGLLDHLDRTGTRLKTLKRVVIGGAACPRALARRFEQTYGVEVIHAWGMTETSPLGVVCSIKPAYRRLEGEAKLDVQAMQGFPPFTVDLKLTDDDDRAMPWNGKTVGRLKVRGPAVAASYFKGGADVLDEEGFFDTGDVASIDPEGYVRITDRSKDVVKSGGEWISSIELENIAVGHPKVFEAAVIGVPHPKWDERPLLVVVAKPGESLSGSELLSFYEGKVAKWWIPDDVVLVDELPHTAAGKISKLELRERLRDHPSARSDGSPTLPS